MERQQNNSAFSINKQLNYPRNTKRTVCHKMNLSRFIIIRLRFILKDKKTRYSLTAKLYLQSCLSGGDGGDVSQKNFCCFPQHLASAQHCIEAVLTFITVNRTQTMQFHFGQLCITHIYCSPTGNCSKCTS